MNRKLYAILDVIANALGPIMVFRHDAAAIRAFADILGNKESMVGRHIADHKLVCLGELDDIDHSLALELGNNGLPRDVLTGSQWLAAQTPTTADSEKPLRIAKEA